MEIKEPKLKAIVKRVDIVTARNTTIKEGDIGVVVGRTHFNDCLVMFDHNIRAVKIGGKVVELSVWNFPPKTLILVPYKLISDGIAHTQNEYDVNSERVWKQTD